jgi:hypothetical protein
MKILTPLALALAVLCVSSDPVVAKTAEASINLSGSQGPNSLIPVAGASDNINDEFDDFNGTSYNPAKGADSFNVSKAHYSTQSINDEFDDFNGTSYNPAKGADSFNVSKAHYSTQSINDEFDDFNGTSYNPGLGKMSIHGDEDQPFDYDLRDSVPYYNQCQGACY